MYVFEFFIYPSIIIMCIYNPIFRKLGNSKVLCGIGKISYQIYLWNLPIQVLIFLVNTNMKLNINFSSKFIWGILFVLNLIWSLIAYLLFEKRLLRWPKNERRTSIGY